MQDKILTPISELINEALKSVLLPNTEFKPNAMFYTKIQSLFPRKVYKYLTATFLYQLTASGNDRAEGQDPMGC